MIEKNKKDRVSFFYKQLIAVVTINILPLFIMSWLLYTNFMSDYKSGLVETMDSEINVLVGTSKSALLFDDVEAATALLDSLKASKSTRYAQIYDANMDLFAEYKRSGQSIDMDINALDEETLFKGGSIYLSKKIMMNDEYLGTAVISADTNSINFQKQRYISIIGLALAGSLLLAYLLNWKLQKRFTKPISDLIGLVGYVAENKLYNKRLDNGRYDEIGNLIVGVNTMLDTIQNHERELYNRAHFDELTQLPNRHLLMERLDHAIDVAKRNNSKIALLFLDLDRFKIVNDSLGHRIGDELLLEVAAKLGNVVRKSDSISRWGGDEFVILLENIHKDQEIDTVVSKILFELAKPTVVGGHLLHVTTSIGIARFPQDGADSVSLLKHADISMYQAKAEGVGQFSYFNPNMLNKSVRRLEMETNLHRAIENEEFFLVYQPQYTSDSQLIVGFEALLRWELDGKLIPPNEFLPIIEEVGLMHRLSLWILQQACMQNMKWQRADLPRAKIAVNLPASFILQPQCLMDIQSALQNTGLAPKYLEIELTEKTFLGSSTTARRTLQSLNDLGVCVAIDDFGTGYSCMSYLQELPVNTLKIDGSFVNKLGGSMANQGIVQSIITLGKSLNMSIVAECVETAEQLDILRAMECDTIQGYYFSKPLHPDDAEKVLTPKANVTRFVRK